MKIPKKIKEMPWPEPWKGGNQNFIVTLSWPVIDHERFLVATFIRNAEKPISVQNVGPDFRLVCSKKQGRARLLFKGDHIGKRKDLRDALYGFGTSPDYCYPEISPKHELALAKWLGQKSGETHNHMIPQLHAWVKNAIAGEKIRERQNRGELMDEEVKLCPDELPDGLVEYIRDTVLLQDDVLIYKKGNVRGTCFLCRENVRARNQRFKQSKYTTCPNCGQRVYALLEGSDRFRVDYVQNIVTLQKGTDGETLFARQWHLLRDPTAKWKDILAQLEEVARYAIRGNHAAKWQREAKENYHMNTVRYKLTDWMRVSSVHALYDGSCFIYIPENWRQLFAGTSLQYCDIEDYARNAKQTRNDRYTVRLLVDWARYPALEKFWKAGYTGLVHERLRGFWARHRYAINWNRGSIRDAIKFPKRLLKLWPPAEWTMDRIQKVTEAWKLVQAGKIREAEIQIWIYSNLKKEYLEDAWGHASAQKIVAYAAKQKYISHYRDYLKDCIRLRLNLDDQAILFPPDLEAAHARTIEQVKYEETKEHEELFQKTRAKGLWMEYEKDGLLIRWPTSGNEIINEGKVLHHCVGGYVKRAAEGKTTILLVRKVNAPDIPYYTLEWLEGRVQQCRTTRNLCYTSNSQVKAFVDGWLEYLKTAKGKKKKEKAA